MAEQNFVTHISVHSATAASKSHCSRVWSDGVAASLVTETLPMYAAVLRNLKGRC